MNWIRQLLARRQLNKDLSEEIQQHIEEKVDELMTGGLSREDAIARARREFGNLTLMTEQGRDVWRWPSVEDFLSDVRFAVRQLCKSPAFAVASILTLALGIGTNTAVFSVVNAVILRPLAYPESEQLISVKSLDLRGVPQPSDLSYPTFFDFRRENKVFEHMVSYRDEEFSLTGIGEPLHLRGEIVSWDLFPMLGVPPSIGRGFLPAEEESGQRVVVISHRLWRERFGGDAAVVGRSVTIDSQPHTIVGVAPPGFSFPIAPEPVDMWTTLSRDADSDTFTPVTKQRGARMLSVMARLKNGVTIERAQAQMDVIASSLAKQYPDTNKNFPRTYLRPEIENLTGNAKPPLLILVAAAGLVLLVACGNVANLLLMRTAERGREFALRAAIGAGRGRLARQLVTESLTLSMIGGTVGVLAAIVTMRLILPLAGNSLPRIAEVSIDGRVLLFSAALAAATSLVFGLTPVLRILKPQVIEGLKEGSQTTTDGAERLRSALCVGQVALGLVLLSAAGLLIASFHNLMNRDLGFQPAGLLSFGVNPQREQTVFYTGLVEKLRSIPGASSAAIAMPLPLMGAQMTVAFNIQDRPAPPGERPRSNMAIVSPGYFSTIGAPVLRGRDFNEQDDLDAAPVLIVNQAFAEKFFPGDDALGKRIEPGAVYKRAGTEMREIVGVVGNAKQSLLSPEPDPIYYFPYKQLPWCCPSVLVRSRAAPLRLEPDIRESVASLDKQLPIYNLRTLDALFTAGMASSFFLVLLLGSFAAMALLLTVTGLYGLLAYGVVRRTREIGLRVALGASPGEVRAMVLRRAMTFVLLGIVIGIAGAVVGGQVLKTVLFGVAPYSPLLLAVACLVVLLAGGLAAFLPARHAASIDPMHALRSE